MRTVFVIAIFFGAIVVVATVAGGARTWAQADGGDPIDAYLQPYVESGNFSGSVVVERGGTIVFNRSYGLADRARRIPNTARTRFHVASMSMQFTAAATLRLVDDGLLKLDEPVSDVVPGLDGAEKIRVRDLLTERSGLPDINELPNYDDEVLQQHQTPTTLVAAIAGKPLLFEPGSKFLHEEHSAYNLLALIIEKKTRLPFRAAVKQLVFDRVGMGDSGIDDDFVASITGMATGYESDGTYDVKAAKPIHWSGKTGNGSAYTTVTDEVRWLSAFIAGQATTPSSRDIALDTSMRVGYGWFKGSLQRFGHTGYYMNGRSPGFGSFMLYLPDSRLAVILLGNLYSSATTTIGYDLAALALGLPYQRLQLTRRALSAEELRTLTGAFQFGPDFYQANAKLTIVADGGQLFLLWPSGSRSPLLPTDRDRFIDRTYWQDVRMERDSSGKVTALVYDRFTGRGLSCTSC